MSSRCLETARLLAAALALALAGPAHAEPARAEPDNAGVAQAGPALRVCADPDNLPYSRADESGFENRIARIVADELHRPLEFVWLPEGRGFVRKTLGADLCDVLVGVPSGFERVATTRPYYRSSYVFVNRADEPRPLDSFDDPRLGALAIGVQLVGDDLVATPPGYALARRGAVARVVGYPVYGDGPAAARATADLAAGRLDAALLWGPQAGWFAAASGVPMRISPAHAPAGLPLPFEYEIAMGVRKADRPLRDALDGALARRAREIGAVLDAWHVPRLPLEPALAANGASAAAEAAR